MATHISPAWQRLRRSGRVLAALAAVAAGIALASCSATDAAPTAAGRSAAAPFGATATQPGVVFTADVPYVSDAELLQNLDVCEPQTKGTARPAVLLIHGGGWTQGDKSDTASQCRWLARSGFVVFNLDYRLAPAARYPAAPDDALAALRFMREPTTVARYEIDPARIGVVGGSAGGNLAAMLALRGSGPLTSGDRVAALVDLSGVMDLRADALTAHQSPKLTADETTYLGCRSLAHCSRAAAASPLRYAGAGDPPTFIGQASVDFVPNQQGDALRAALEKAGVPVTLEQRPGAYHSFNVITPKMGADIIDFLHANLGT